MKKEKFLTISVVFLLVLNAGIVTFLFINRPTRPPELFELVVRELGFDAQQKSQYIELRNEHRASMNKLDQDFQLVLNQYLDQLRSDINTTLEDSLANQLAAIEKEKATVTLSHFRSVRSLCRLDQFEEFDALIPKLTLILLPPQKKGPPRRK